MLKLFVVMISLWSCEPLWADSGFTPEQEALFDLFKSRRSVRKFKPAPVPKAHLMKILDMARMAPTAGNQQPWKFLVIQDREKLDQLKEECLKMRMDAARKQGADPKKLEQIKKQSDAYYSDYLSAPVYVVVLTDKGSLYPSYNVYDGSLAAGNLMLAARAFGYGTVFSQDSIPYDLIKKVFDIPGQFERVCFTPIGIPDKWPDPKPKKSLEEFLVFEQFVEGKNYKKFEQKKRVAIEVALEVLERYVGTYQYNADLSFSVTLDKNRLFVQAPGLPKTEIFPESETAFFLKIADIQITFNPDEGGKTKSLVFHQRTGDLLAKKIK